VDSNAKRTYLIAAIFLVVAVTYLIRLFSLQVIDTSYKLSATNNVVRRIVNYPARGLVYDRKGTLLVYNQAAYDVLVTPRELQPFDTLNFCNITGVTKEELKEQLQKAKDYSYFKPSVIIKQLSAQRYAILQEQLYKFSGFFVQTRTLREYPQKIASHVLGYVGEVNQQMIKKDPYYETGDYAGITGLEKSYEKELRGKKGVNYLMVDVHNRIKGSFQNGRYDTTAVIGENVVTSLDADLQRYGEKLMQGKAGSIVAIEPSTGEVLALVSSPTYDPNLLVGRDRGEHYLALARDTLNPLFNRALMAQYPPGSTFKMVNALIGLQEGVLTPHMRYWCHHGYTVGNYHMGCHHDSAFALTGSIAESCNAYYAQEFRSIMENPKYPDVRQAYDTWRKYVMSFGFGRKLGTDFPNELKGFVPSSNFYEKYVFKGSRWRALPIISLAIGQGELGITPLQLANYAAILANRGYYYIPHIVKKIQRENIPTRFTERHYTDIDTTQFPKIIEGMKEVLKPGGTAAMSRIPGITMCGKTGTAQNPHGADHSVFMAFAPADHPKIAISVYVENGVWGARYAAPIASLMIEKYLTDSISSGRKWLEKRMLEANLLEPKKPKKEAPAKTETTVSSTTNTNTTTRRDTTPRPAATIRRDTLIRQDTLN